MMFGVGTCVCAETFIAKANLPFKVNIISICVSGPEKYLVFVEG